MCPIVDIKEEKISKRNNNVKRGQYLEHLIKNTIEHYCMEQKILLNIYDRPKKVQQAGYKLLSDYWFVDYLGRFNLIECKVIDSITSFPFSRIDDHQYMNLYRTDKAKHSSGWLIINFKMEHDDFAFYRIYGKFLFCLKHNYCKVMNKYGVISEDRKSFTLNDLRFLRKHTKFVL